MTNNQIESIEIHKKIRQAIDDSENIQFSKEKRKFAQEAVKSLFKELAGNWEGRDGKNTLN